MAKRIADSTFVVACHGKEEGPPAVGVWQFLAARARRVDTIYHPLIKEDGASRRHTTYAAGRPARRRTRKLPAWPPYTYPVDVLLPLRPPRADLWLGFNNLVAARGLAQRGLGRVGQVAYWAVDFVPDRFGAGSPLTRAYDALDACCCRRVDHHVELSQAAADARAARLALREGDAAPTQVVPVGAWLDRTRAAPEDGHAARRVVFVGHLVPRMGLQLGLQAIALLAARGAAIELDVVGHGEQEAELHAEAERLGIADRVTFHGFIGDQRELADVISRSAVALAPYAPDPSSFTRFADPSKLKGYLAGGLPILLTDVPPNARELESDAGAEVVPYQPEAWADAIERALANPAAWRARRAAALAYADRFDWNVLLERAFARMGFEA